MGKTKVGIWMGGTFGVPTAQTAGRDSVSGRLMGLAHAGREETLKNTPFTNTLAFIIDVYYNYLLPGCSTLNCTLD